jgi:hypothetical protein
MKLEEVQVNEILGFLDKFSPASLGVLRAEFPDDAEEIKSGFIAGEQNERNRLKIRSSIISLQEVVKNCELQLPGLTQRLGSRRKIRFVAEVLSIVGGASIWGVLRTNNVVTAEILAALLTLFGSILALTNWYYATNIEDEQVLEVRAKLIAFKVEAQALLDELIIFKGATTDDEFEIVAPSVARANKLCRDARELLERIKESA